MAQDTTAYCGNTTGAADKLGGVVGRVVGSGNGDSAGPAQAKLCGVGGVGAGGGTGTRDGILEDVVRSATWEQEPPSSSGQKAPAGPSTTSTSGPDLTRAVRAWHRPEVGGVARGADVGNQREDLCTGGEGTSTEQSGKLPQGASFEHASQAGPASLDATAGALPALPPSLAPSSLETHMAPYRERALVAPIPPNDRHNGGSGKLKAGISVEAQVASYSEKLTAAGLVLRSDRDNGGSNEATGAVSGSQGVWTSMTHERLSLVMDRRVHNRTGLKPALSLGATTSSWETPGLKTPLLPPVGRALGATKGAPRAPGIHHLSRMLGPPLPAGNSVECQWRPELSAQPQPMQAPTRRETHHGVLHKTREAAGTGEGAGVGAGVGAAKAHTWSYGPHTYAAFNRDQEVPPDSRNSNRLSPRLGLDSLADPGPGLKRSACAGAGAVSWDTLQATKRTRSCMPAAQQAPRILASSHEGNFSQGSGMRGFVARLPGCQAYSAMPRLPHQRVPAWSEMLARFSLPSRGVGAGSLSRGGGAGSASRGPGAGTGSWGRGGEAERAVVGATSLSRGHRPGPTASLECEPCRTFASWRTDRLRHQDTGSLMSEGLDSSGKFSMAFPCASAWDDTSPTGQPQSEPHEEDNSDANQHEAEHPKTRGPKLGHSGGGKAEAGEPQVEENLEAGHAEASHLGREDQGQVMSTA